MSTSLIATYSITPRRFVVHDALSPEEHIDFHAENDDYFATLATIVSIIAECLHENACKGESPDDFQIRALQRIKTELMYLQRTYRITPRTEE